MAFLTNKGSFPTMPFSSTESYLQLAHPAVADVLLLQELGSDGSGYEPPSLQGLQAAQGRAATSALIVAKSGTPKLEWRDLAFVCSPQQKLLLEQLAIAQSGAVPVTVVDNMLKTAVTKLVSIELNEGYVSVYSTLSNLLVQFALLEV